MPINIKNSCLANEAGGQDRRLEGAMEGTQSRYSSGIPLFFQEYGGYLRRWAEKIEQRVNVGSSVVAISRKGPRLLELLAKYQFLNQDILDKVVTESATGFQRYEKIVLLDDSLIHGSTYLDTRNNIKHINPTVEIFDAPFVVGKTCFPQARELIQCFGMALREEELEQYIIHFTQALHTLCKPILTAQPIIEVSLHDLFARNSSVDAIKKIAESIHDFAASSEGSCFNVVRTVAMTEDLDAPSARTFCSQFYVWNVSVPNIVESRSPKSKYNDVASFKLYVDKNDQVLRIVPCTQLSFSLERQANARTNWQESIIDRFSKPLQDFCYEAVPQCTPDLFDGINGKDKMDELFRRTCINPMDGGSPYSEIPSFLLRYLATFHNYLASLQLFRCYHKKLSSTLGSLLGWNNKEVFQLSKDNIRFLVGSKLAEKHDNILPNLLEQTDDFMRFGEVPLENVARESFPQCSSGIFVERLAEQQALLEEKFRSSNSDQNRRKELIAKKVAFAFELFFRRQHYDVEIYSRRASTTYRLFFGNNFESLAETVLDLAGINDDRENALHIVRQQFESNFDNVTMVPYYFIHCREYSTPLQFQLKDKTLRMNCSNRYGTVSYLTQMFRVGEGVPRHIRRFYVQNLLLYVFSQYFRLPNEVEIPGDNIREKWFKAYTKLLLNENIAKRCNSVFREVFSDDDAEGNMIPLDEDKSAIPLLVASYQEQLSLCTSNVVNELKMLALKMNKIVSGHHYSVWDKIREDWKQNKGVFFQELLDLLKMV